MVVGLLRAPSISRIGSRLVALCLCLVLGLLVSGTRALAAGLPEAPITGACPSLVAEAGEGPMCGTLNPLKSEKLTSASFAYDTGSSCMGGQESPSAGEFEGEGIQIYGNLSGLQPGTEYTYCLVAANISGETFGQPVSFTTTAAPKIEAATSVTSTSAILAGTLEPIDAVLHYKFLLSKGTACEGAFGTPPAAGENKVSAQVEGLTPNTEYTFCLLAIGHEGFAFNGEENWGVASGGPEHFTTKRSQAEIEAQEKLEQEAKAKSEAEAAAKKEQEEAAAAKRQEEEAAAARRREEAAKEAWTKKTEGASKPVLVFITKVEVRTAAVTITISASNNGAATVSGPDLRTTTKSVGQGTSQIRVVLTNTGKRDRRHHKMAKLTVHLRAAGKVVSVSRMVRL
jgi:hypothetical protein